MNCRFALAALTLAFAQGLHADTVTIPASADAGLFQFSPNNNLGATDALQIGTNNQGTFGRGLFRFDVGGQIPPNARIDSVEVSFNVTAVSTSAPPAAHTLSRMQLDWAEGDKPGNKGLPAEAGESTWDARRQGEQQWTVPGGAAGTDFAPAPSATVSFADSGEYTFASNADLVSDVQLWLDHPDTDFGWMLAAQTEGAGAGSRRIASRENALLAPSLTIEFIPFEIETITVGESVDISWQGGKTPFDVETAMTLNGDWTTSASAVTERSATVARASDDQFFRVRETAAATSARYRVTWKATWSVATHPTSFPSGAHFSNLYGATHDANDSLWEPGGTATTGIKNMAERGSNSALRSEIIANIGAERLLEGNSINSPGQTQLEFDITQAHPLVSLVCMVAPSPDWFVGVHGHRLFRDGEWIESETVALQCYDAGTDSGTIYTSSNAATSPQAPIQQITPAGETRPLGTFTFERIAP